MSEDTDAELVFQLREGSTEAYQQLLDRHLASINRYVVRMMGNTIDSDDITQEVFIRLWEKSYQFNPEVAKLSTWLHQIAHNMCIDFFRKQMKTSDSNLEENSGGLEPQKELLKVRQASTINQAMESLPERQRSAVVMCHYQGLSNREAAGILDVSVDALESLLSRGRKRLRESLKGDAI